jgi:replication-associated recombination protein RarA
LEAQYALTISHAREMFALYADVIDPYWVALPLHLRNAVNKVVKAEGYGKDHIRYPWKEEAKGKVVEQEYLPDNLKGKKYYQP